MFYIVDIAKALACLLIANFHSDILYPDRLSLLAFGGDIGNNIFFLVSGFALLPSVEKCDTRDMGKWYFKRVFRLLPMLTFFYFLTWITGGVTIHSFNDAVREFVFPTMYWFTGAIILFYFIFFIFEKYTNSIVRGGCIILLAILHLFWDNMQAEVYFIGFIAMLIGAWIRRNFPELVQKIKTKKMLPAILLTGVLYLVLKFLRRNGIEILGLIHLGIGLLTICLATEIILWGGAYEKRLKLMFEKHSGISCIVRKLSEITLAVYLFMGLNDRVIMYAIKDLLPFPFSYLLNMAISLVGAYAITTIDKRLHKLKR